MTLTDFLAARLDEDEAGAKAAQKGALGIVGELAAQAGPCVSDAGYAHIARHDPARALREVEAGRVILAAHDVAEHYCPLPVVPGRHGQLWTPEEGPCWTLRLLAAAWNDHPDYDEAWKP